MITETKSLFKGDQDVLRSLKQHAVEEVHVVGVDTNDCIITTAFEAFDLGFLPMLSKNVANRTVQMRLMN